MEIIHICTLPIKPTPKPRQNQADRWRKRPPVLRYRAFCDEVRQAVADLGITPQQAVFPAAWVVFHIATPPSWSKKKAQSHWNQPHLPKPDADNLLKAYMDALLGDDSAIWDVRPTKIWASESKICVYRMPTYHETMGVPLLAA